MLKLLPKSINIFNSLLMSVCLYFFCVCVNEHLAVISQLSRIVMSYQQHTTTIAHFVTIKILGYNRQAIHKLEDHSLL